ncbi:MAG: S8 family serine peptidase [Bacteroidia bacterium]|nr:S8 family serine peptidase [Bacteroidia bacterium]
MINKPKLLPALLVMLFLMATGFANAKVLQIQDTTHTHPKDWQLLDPADDHVHGVSAEKTYQTLLKGKPSKTVLVAVIDSGIDINHEDLKDIIWTNEDEIPGNGIDDDKNGYVDDVHGWSFIGGKNGNVDQDTYELTREYVRLKPKYGSMEESKVGKKQKEEFAYWKKVEKAFEEKAQEAQQQYKLYNTFYENISVGNDTLKKILGVPKLTKEMVEQLKSNDQVISMAKSAVIYIFQNVGEDADVDEVLSELKEAVDYYGKQAKYGYNTDFDPRSIVGDNYSDLSQRNYGNNDVIGPDPSHGTHVAGIIAANRTNDIGMKGVADNVRIMVVRAVPDGDERDKDVANAIYYAVDNGARIINMSFGKDYSPQKEAVDKAVKYAETKGVLLVHAAGNDGSNNDDGNNYPSRLYADGKEAKTWIEIGASAWGSNEEFVASFSNYGKKTVDFFSPGHEIYSSVPGNLYEDNSGTSMASPVTAGVAAMLMEYFPTLTAAQVKEILRASTRKFDGLKVIKPGSDELTDLSKISITGGLVNAYEAVKLAMSMSGQNPEK